MPQTNKNIRRIRKRLRSKSPFEKFALKVTRASGSSWSFMLALLVVIVWLVTGPVFNYSDTWQLVINTGTTVVTFLMVFLIQKSQNRDALMIHLKLNELIASQNGASNRLLDIEDLSEEELVALIQFYVLLNKKAKTEYSLTKSHTIEEAEEWHREKSSGRHRGKETRSSQGKETKSPPVAAKTTSKTTSKTASNPKKT